MTYSQSQITNTVVSATSTRCDVVYLIFQVENVTVAGSPETDGHNQKLSTLSMRCGYCNVVESEDWVLYSMITSS